MAKFTWARKRQFAFRLAVVVTIAWVIYAGTATMTRIPHYYGTVSTSRSDVEQAEYLDCFQTAGVDIVIIPSPIRGAMGLPYGDCPAQGLEVGLADCLDTVKLEAVKRRWPDLEKKCLQVRQVVEDRFDSNYRYERQQRYISTVVAIARDFLLVPLGIFIFFGFIAHPAAVWLMRGLRDDIKVPK